MPKNLTLGALNAILKEIEQCDLSINQAYQSFEQNTSTPELTILAGGVNGLNELKVLREVVFWLKRKIKLKQQIKADCEVDKSALIMLATKRNKIQSTLHR